MPEPFDGEHLRVALETIANTPDELQKVVSDLDDEQLDTQYRPDGWTIRQLVHHMPDSHLNGYVRMKWALTEKLPTIKMYDQFEWAELEDGKTAEIQMSLDLLRSLHRRWMHFMSALDENQRSHAVMHPDWGTVTVDFLIAQYAWHGMHHIAQVRSLRERAGW